MKKEKQLSRFERLMCAVTFAEAGEFETAREFIRTPLRKQDRYEKRAERPVRRA